MKCVVLPDASVGGKDTTSCRLRNMWEHSAVPRSISVGDYMCVYPTLRTLKGDKDLQDNFDIVFGQIVNIEEIHHKGNDVWTQEGLPYKVRIHISSSGNLKFKELPIEIQNAARMKTASPIRYATV